MKNTSHGTYSLGLLMAALVLAVTFALALPAEAKTKTPAPQIDIATLIEQIKQLQNLIKQRNDFNLNGPTTIAERPEYFALNLAENSTKILTGDDLGAININTDGGVSQILLITECSELKGVLTLGQSPTCVEKTWLNKFTEKDGVRSFTLPVSYITRETEAQLNFSAYACRYNGCIYEKDFSIQYKVALDFADTFKIYDRYEWTYEWDDEVYHVQEVLLSFPYKDIRRIKLVVRCDTSGLYIRTDEDNRATCNNRREYGQPDFRDYTTDEQGNTYNLKIESVTKNIQKENVGAVAMTFTFINKSNHVVYEVTHRPVQLDVEEESDDEEDEDR